MTGISRRSALRIAGAGGVNALGGSALAGCDGHNGPSAQPHSTTSAPATTPRTIATDPPITTPAGRNPSSIRPTWQQQFQPGHGWKADGDGTASAELNDTQMFIAGQQSVRVTTTGSGKQSSVRMIGMPAVDLTGKLLRITLRVDDVKHLHKLSFYVGTGKLGDHFFWEFHTHQNKGPTNYVQSAEWVVITLQWSDVSGRAGVFTLSPLGVPSATSGFTAMSLAAYDDAAGPITYRIQSIEALPDTRTIFPKGVVSITFDDSYASVYNLALPEMTKRKLTGTMYNIAQIAGTAGHLTVPQMRTLQDAHAWEMAGHAYATAVHDAGYSTLTSGAVESDMAHLHDWLSANRFSADNLAYPHGYFQPTTDGVPVDKIASKHFATARTIVSETIESFIPAMPYRLKALTGLNDGVNVGGSPLNAVTALGARMDRCVTGGDWLILCFHDISAGTPNSSTQISHVGFASVLDAIAKRGMAVATVAEAMKHYM